MKIQQLTVKEVKDVLKNQGEHSFIDMVGHKEFIINEIFYSLIDMGFLSSIEEASKLKIEEVIIILNSLDDNFIILRSKENDNKKMENNFFNHLTPALQAVWE